MNDGTSSFAAFISPNGFYRADGMQTQSSDENSVCLSVKCMICDEKKEVVPTFLHHIKDHLP